MSNEFTITAASNSVQLSANRQGSAAYTVFNASGRPITGRATLESVPKGEAHAAWLSVAGASERPFVIGAAEQFTVNVNAPADAATGSYTFRLKMVDVANTDEGVTDGPTVTVVVPPPPPPRPKFPIWIIPIIVGVLVVVAIVVVLLSGSDTVTMPDVIGLAEVDAEGTLVASDLEIGRIRDEASDAVPAGLVARTEPEAEAETEKSTPVNVFISTGPNATNTPTPTPILPTPTPTNTLEPDTPTPDPGAWGGQWTTFCDVLDCADMSLTQVGDRVNGTFGNGLGTIDGIVQGNRLSGTMSYSGATSSFDFWLDDSGLSWRGNWNRVITWCGHRAGQSRPSPCGVASWYGTWQANAGLGPMTLFQDGQRVFGTYAGTDGRIEASASGTSLGGNWLRGSNQGTIQFFLVLTTTGQQFQGNWNAENAWCGFQAGAGLPSTCHKSQARLTITDFAVPATELEFVVPDIFFLIAPTATPSS